MRAVIQRVLNAQLYVDEEEISCINKGCIIFLGIGAEDKEEDVIKLSSKIVKLRIYEDTNNKMNLNIKDYGGEILLVSQFTLYADCYNGNRPSFTGAKEPNEANRLYLMFKDSLINENLQVKTGIFGADMKINVMNDGPVTIILDSKNLK